MPIPSQKVQTLRRLTAKVENADALNLLAQEIADGTFLNSDRFAAAKKKVAEEVIMSVGYSMSHEAEAIAAEVLAHNFQRWLVEARGTLADALRSRANDELHDEKDLITSIADAANYFDR